MWEAAEVNRSSLALDNRASLPPSKFGVLDILQIGMWYSVTRKHFLAEEAFEDGGSVLAMSKDANGEVHGSASYVFYDAGMAADAQKKKRKVGSSSQVDVDDEDEPPQKQKVKAKIKVSTKTKQKEKEPASENGTKKASAKAKATPQKADVKKEEGSKKTGKQNPEEADEKESKKQKKGRK